MEQPQRRVQPVLCEGHFVLRLMFYSSYRRQTVSEDHQLLDGPSSKTVPTWRHLRVDMGCDGYLWSKQGHGHGQRQGPGHLNGQRQGQEQGQGQE